MATAAASTKETTNYARLCRLLVDVGTQALRDKFNGIHSPANLQAVLAANKPMLQTLRARKIINPTQWGKLFPVILSSVSSASFDITLLMVLFRNICGLAAPASGWDVLPPSTDISPEADIARVKYYRNTVYAHAERASVDELTFNKYWSEIRDTLVRLGGVAYKAAVDNLETDCMDPGMEEHYKELLRQWKNDEDNIKDKLNEMDSDIKNLTKKIDDLVEAAVTSRTEASDEGKIVNPGMSFDTSLVCREKHHESELLTSFCEQCKVCICDKCGQTRHSHHTKVDIHQAAKECKVDIKEIAEEMKKQVADFQMQVENSKERTRKSREEIAAARNKALTSLEELIQLLKKHETTTMTNLDLQEETELRGHTTQLEHFQTSITKLQKSVEYCEVILQRNESIEILQVHQPLLERYRGLLNVEKLNINKPVHTALHARYEINDELVKTLRCAVPGRLVVSNTDHLQSVAEGKGLKEADVGNEAEVVITTKDSNQKQCYDEDDQIIVKVKAPSGEELNSKITHRKDGEYSVTYTPDCVGQHDVVIEVNGQPLTGSPWSLNVSPHHYRLLFSFGSFGKAQGQLNYPFYIAIDENTGNIAVAHYGNNTVQLFSSERKHLNTMSGKEIIKPSSVAFTKTSDLIVLTSDKIFCFNESGKVSKNITNKHLEKPFRLTIARDGRMVVCDHGDCTVKVLSPDGTQLLLTIRDPDFAAPISAVSHQDMFVVGYYPTSNVKVFSKDGVFLRSIGTYGTGDGQRCLPIGLSVDSFSNLVVCGSKNRRLQILTLDGDLVSKIEGEHTGLVFPHSVAVSPTGQLYITDAGKHCIHVFQ